MNQFIKIGKELAYATAGAAFTNTTSNKFQNCLRRTCKKHELLIAESNQNAI
jgi:hypothetical protein